MLTVRGVELNWLRSVRRTYARCMSKTSLPKLPVENPSLCTAQEHGNADGSVSLDHGEAERMTLPYPL